MPIVRVEAGATAVSVYGDRIHQGHDFCAAANAPLDRLEVLVFFDSRGISGHWEGSLLQLVLDYLGDRPWLALARPVNLTTWATLLNTVVLNELAPDVIVTNVGLVDCTPKKRSLCDDMLDQVRFTHPRTASRLQYLEPYRLSSGATEDLYSVDYCADYVTALRACAGAQRTIAIKTPRVRPDLPLPRARPASFFSQLDASNHLVDAIGCHGIELGEFDGLMTYDAVHWTREANHLIFEKIRKAL